MPFPKSCPSCPSMLLLLLSLPPATGKLATKTLPGGSAIGYTYHHGLVHCHPQQRQEPGLKEPKLGGVEAQNAQQAKVRSFSNK